jgi:bifunctional non-homologous end joining protein LigD
MAKDILSEYSAKRRFEATPEPRAAPAAKRSGPLLFVVQKHAATRLHYDLRLELDGVLLSWAIPKGPSLDRGEKRLAMRTEDHPFEYASFEGTIPKGQYGAGTMIVWDCGVYGPDEGGVYDFDDREAAQRRIRAELAAGKVSFTLRGEKLKGSFALVKTREANQWLLLKHKDRFASEAEILDRDASVLGGARMPAAQLVPSGPMAPMPAKLAPMLAETAGKPFVDPAWAWEPKLDGYRVLAFIDGDRVTLRSRKGLDVTGDYAAVAKELAGQHVRGMILDGELVAFDATGRPSFAAMQAGSANIAFCAFDLLYFAGVDLRGASYRDRRRYLAQCLLPSPRVQRVHSEDDGLALHDAAVATGFEGVIGKRPDSRYEAGKRSACWVKVKPMQTAEFVVGGYTRGKGRELGALLVGAREGRKLVYASHVGSGFDDRTLDDLDRRLEPLTVDKCPFSEMPDLGGKPTRWVKPQLVAEVQYQGWTEEGRLRAPVFLRLRDDVKPAEIGSRPRTAPAAVGMTGEVVTQLDKAKASCTLLVGPHQVKLTNLDRVYWPANAELEQPPFTKRDLLRYLAQVSPYMLPHLADRPLTMIRMPSGIEGERFFQKHWEQARPEFVESITVFSGHKDESHEYLLCNNLPTLLWLAQAGTLEFHVWHSRASVGPDCITAKTDYATSLESLEASVLNYPDYVLFDIDPYIYSGKEAKGAEPELNTAAFEKGKEVAFHVRELLNTMGLEPIVKTSGKTGLHVFLPVKRTLDFDAARHVSELVGRHLVSLHPDDVTVEWSIPKRTGKIFMDYNMNVRGKTLNVAYSPRGVAGAPVSMPLTWEELEAAHPLDFRLDNAIARLAATGDRWQDALERKQDLERAIARAKE